MSDLLTLFTAPLEAAKIEYIVTGSVAAMVYGEPRLTHDIDLVVVLRDEDIETFAAAFPEHTFYCAPTEVIRVEARRPQRGHFNVIHYETGYKADIYMSAKDPLHRWALANARSIPFADTMLSVAPPEYVITRKLEFYREGGSRKHLADIRGILRHARETIDMPTLTSFISDRGLGPQWAEVADGKSD